MEPHTTNVPAEKNPINNDKPLSPQGIFPPPAKKPFISLPIREMDIAVARTPAENNRIVIKSM